VQITDPGSEQHCSPRKPEETDRSFTEQPSSLPEIDRQSAKQLSLQTVLFSGASSRAARATSIISKRSAKDRIS
jgi:hypothetical protein